MSNSKGSMHHNICDINSTVSTYHVNPALDECQAYARQARFPKFEGGKDFVRHLRIYELLRL